MESFFGLVLTMIAAFSTVVLVFTTTPQFPFQRKSSLTFFCLSLFFFLFFFFFFFCRWKRIKRIGNLTKQCSGLVSAL